MVIVFGFFLTIFLLLISAHIKNVIIDTSGKTISFQNIISRKIKTYSFADFDGFIDTFLNHRAAQYKTIGFIKDKKVIRYLDSFWFSNYSELRVAISSLDYLGTFNFGTWKRLKLLLRLQVIDWGKPAHNIALPKLGLDLGTCTAAMWQLQLWAGLVLINFTFYFSFKFSIYHFHRAGQSLNIPTSAMQTVMGKLMRIFLFATLNIF
jgi:hypothetical protein